MIDAELVTRKMVLVAEDLPAVERLARLSLEEFLGDRERSRSICLGCRNRVPARSRRVPVLYER
jgi:hypothetical protein